jgi:hypothetical protein
MTLLCAKISRFDPNAAYHFRKLDELNDLTDAINASQFGYVFLGLFTSFRTSQPILFGVVYSLFFIGSVPAGGILFGIAFWSIARNIRSNVVKQYKMILAYGMMILFSSNQASALVRFFYPPFGLVTLSFFGMASYLIFIGIYSSAISVAEDSELREYEILNLSKIYRHLEMLLSTSDVQYH